ncbi:MAG: T9SS type A sorting domain-containing protein [Tannerella sp.]|jgi:hypothetical protein|nr:T9SS type A sorting domain-containing protein [Tannerella sp.]
MNKMIFSWLFCFVTVCLSGQEVCWYLFGQKTCYEVSAARILIKSATLDIPGIEKALQNPVAGNLKDIYNLGDGLFLIEMQHTDKEDMRELQRLFGSREDVIFTSPVFEMYPGAGYKNEVIVMLKSKDDYPVLEEYAGAYHIKDIRTNEYLGSQTCILILPHNSEKDAMQVALELYETGLFVYAEPNGIDLCPFEWCPYGPEGSSMNTVMEEQTIVFYPNPVRDILYVDLERIQHKTSGSNDIRLYNSLGNMCRQTKATGGTVELSVSNLPAGIYFLMIYDGSAQKSEAHKIIVKH